MRIYKYNTVNGAYILLEKQKLSNRIKLIDHFNEKKNFFLEILYGAYMKYIVYDYYIIILY